MIKIIIPFEPVSVNEMYAVSRGRKVKTHKARIYADQIYHVVRGLKISQEELLDVRIELYGKWWNLNGTLKKKDLANYEKAMIDSIFANLKADDAQIIKNSMEKINDEKFYSIVYIKLLPKGHKFWSGKPLPKTKKTKKKK